MDSITQTITDYASTSAFEHLTEEVVHAAKQRLIDSLGCAVGVHDCEPAQIGRRLARGQTPGKYPGRVLYFGDRLRGESAAFSNTSMIRNVDFNDRYPGGHPSDCLGALLALGRNAVARCELLRRTRPAFQSNVLETAPQCPVLHST